MYLVAKVRCSSKRTDRFTLLSSKRKHESSLTSMQFTPVSMFVETLRSVCLLKLSIYRQCPVIDCLANNCTVHTTNAKSYRESVLPSLSSSSYLGFPLSGFQTLTH